MLPDSLQTLALAEISPEAYKEISSTKIYKARKTWSVPTLSRGRLFVRSGEELICLDLRAVTDLEGCKPDVTVTLAAVSEGGR